MISDTAQSSILANRRVAFVGRLGGITRREAAKIVRQHDGIPVDLAKPESGLLPDLVVIGAEELPMDTDELLTEEIQTAAAGDFLEMDTFVRIVALVVCVIGGIVVYFATCLLVGLRPASLRPQAQTGGGGHVRS